MMRRQESSKRDVCYAVGPAVAAFMAAPPRKPPLPAFQTQRQQELLREAEVWDFFLSFFCTSLLLLEANKM